MKKAALFAALLITGFAVTNVHGAEKFEPTVESLRKYRCPDWFRDAKFGIYLHWGAYSVAERGEWYARNLYIEERPEYAHHLENYDHHNMQMHDGKLEGVMCIKERPFQGLYADGLATLDFERGKASHILQQPWQTDDSIGSWGYNTETPYTTSDAQIDKFIDIVSKNGNLLLNIPIRADGTLDETATGILEEIGAWMRVNGEAIYGTRPWYTFGEGPTHIPHKTIESPCTWKDIRYTVKGDYLYIFLLDWPGHRRDVVLGMLAPTNYRIGKVESVELLGHEGPIQWKQAPDGLTVRFPEKKPCEFAYALKILLPKK